MAALVQGYPHSGTVTALQTRPSSASGMLQSVPVQSTTQFIHGSSHSNGIHGLPTTATAPVVYRGGSGHVQQQYTFKNMPSLNQTAQWQQYRTQRTSSSPAVPTMQSVDYLHPAVPHSRYSASMSMTNLPSTENMGLHLVVGTRDDSSLPVPGTKKPAMSLRHPQPDSGTSSQPSLAPSAPIRPAPERYRRSALRTDSTGVSGSSTTSPHLRPSHSAMLDRPKSSIGPSPGLAVDDMRFAQAQESVKRVRRRSMPALDSPDFPIHLTPHDLKQPGEASRPRSADKDGKAIKTENHTIPDKSSKDEQADSGRSAGANVRPSSSGNRSGSPSNPAINHAMPPSREEVAAVRELTHSVNVPPRSSSSDGSNAKQAPSPSPRATPVAMESDGGNGQPTDAAHSAAQEAVPSPRFESPAVRRLTELNERRGKPKSKTSRLRRAFSFGSAAEFRKAAHGSDTPDSGTGKLHKDRKPDEAYDDEQERIAKQQEAAGIGNNIYSGGRFFHGSTDNLSISSTASSASIMIRKMGRGMKKGTRSLVGLFRPKSIVGSPVAEATPAETSQAAVTMITVEAERELVNVNPDPKAQGGGTGFPRLERNSIDAAKVPALEPERLGSSGTDSTAARKSIVGGEKERAEVLAAVRKGILKNRTGSSSPSPKPSETKGSAFDPPAVPSYTDSPNSSAPSTPNEESQGHKRAGTVAIGSEDYFVSALRLRQDSNKSSPGTPHGTKRNATFSPRIVFFETWPSQEYDRRGEIATCNRLTPMLAQQIKEELNTFKMEMEVHENSKIYTHFF
ncbi:hypothetical protein N658DRAFT_34048 [Parathielavia hyrcaniae]|uniref:Protein BNI4 n=1 Tax=Parathielavia hyrcaniae TaxID=113614 RepID=A0AAN6T7K4_9PEZI|nr:hypothetical protein N658DRAFT_34048 [Parathielavia hyrcaniae]